MPAALRQRSGPRPRRCAAGTPRAPGRSARARRRGPSPAACRCCTMRRIKASGVGRQHEDARALDQRPHAALGARGEPGIPRGDPLIEQQDVGIDRRGDGEAQPRHHAGGVGADRQVEVLAKLAELGDLRQLAVELVGRHAQEHAAGLDVLVAVVLGIEAGRRIEQRRDLAVDPYRPRVRGRRRRPARAAASTCPPRCARRGRCDRRSSG